GGLSKDEIERMQRDAESHAADDKRKRDLAEARNTADQRVYQLEKLLDENKEKLSESDRSALRAAIDRGNAVKKEDDPAAIRQATEELQRASHAMAEHLYAANATAGAEGAPQAGAATDGASTNGGGQAGKPDDVIDVEFEEKK